MIRTFETRIWLLWNVLYDFWRRNNHICCRSFSKFELIFLLTKHILLFRLIANLLVWLELNQVELVSFLDYNSRFVNFWKTWWTWTFYSFLLTFCRIKNHSISSLWERYAQYIRLYTSWYVLSALQKLNCAEIIFQKFIISKLMTFTNYTLDKIC